jgi:outer membrane protein TolC
MKKNIIILIVFLSGMTPAYTQKILTLKECYDMAMASSALSSEKENYSQISRLRDENLMKNWLPAIDAGGSILYNSSVIDMKSVLGELPLPGIGDLIKPLPHEQYKLTVDINQVIYDGGSVKNARLLEKADLGVNRKQTEADLYKLRAQINTCYFSLLLIGRHKELLSSYLQLVDKRISSMQSALANDMIIRSDIDVLTSERISLNQQIRENEIMKTALVRVLSSLTGTDISETTEFTTPLVTSGMETIISRPELELLDMKKEQLSAGLKVIESKRMPKAFGFATFGYGNPPGNNFFKDEFAPYFIAGASLKWNIFDWSRTRNEKQVISLQKSIIENRKSDLNEAIKRQLETKNAEIENLKSLVESDKDLIRLRKQITASAESQYENGTITAAELMNQINSEKQAVINNEIHKINLEMARIEYLNISGKDIE